MAYPVSHYYGVTFDGGDNTDNDTIHEFRPGSIDGTQCGRVADGSVAFPGDRKYCSECFGEDR